MSSEDISLAVDWAAVEGWNPGHSDAMCFASVDPEGFMGGWLGEHMIASISVVNYDPSFAFLGFYIVDASYRGQGYGYKLWQHAVEHAGKRLIGLDGVPAEQENYRRSGFQLAYRNIRYGGVPAAGFLAGAKQNSKDLQVASVAGLSPEIAGFDRTVFPAPREAFLKAWVSAPGHVSIAAYRDGTAVGYGLIRPCRNGHKIGPLFAESRQGAETILAELFTEAGITDKGGEVFLDAPEPNAAATALAADLGLQPVFETARMYTGPAPEIAVNNIFGVTTFELG